MSESTPDRNPDRLFPMEPTARAIARDLYESVRELPIISPHGHVPAAMIREDRPFTDPSDLFLSVGPLRDSPPSRQRSALRRAQRRRWQVGGT